MPPAQDTVETRQRTELLFETKTPLGGAASTTFDDLVREVAGYSAVMVMAVADQAFTILISEACVEGTAVIGPAGVTGTILKLPGPVYGPFAVTETLTSTLDAVTGRHYICDRVRPCGTHMKAELENSGGAMTVLEACILGLPLSGGGGAGGGGTTGPAGPTGPAGGPQGVTGLQGATGVGAQGVTGIQGVTGPGGGSVTGIQVVPANNVVASTRQDFPLTQAGLVAAIAALPATGGYIYLGDGTLALTSTVVIDRDLKLVGAGRDATIITVAGAIAAFSIGDFALTMEDLQVSGDGTAGQTFMLQTAATSGETFLNRVYVNGVDIVIDADDKGRNYTITASTLTTTTLTGFVLLDGPTQSWVIFGSRLDGEIDAPTTIFLISNSTITAGNASNLSFGNSTKISGSAITATTMTFALDCQISGCRILGDVTAGNLCRFSGCSIENDVVASGVQISIAGCNLQTFSSDGFNGHTIVGNVFEGGGDNLTLDDSSNCTVQGNVDCQVLEVGSANGNRYDDNQGFSGSTIIGPTSVVNGARRFGGAAATADAYATLFTVLNFKGLLGYGTIKNTDGADSMTVEEQGIDAFGTTDVRETVVAFGDDMPLDPTDFLGTARPPYTSYRVRVKNTSAGNNAAYSVQFVSQGDVS